MCSGLQIVVVVDLHDRRLSSHIVVLRKLLVAKIVIVVIFDTPSFVCRFITAVTDTSLIIIAVFALRFVTVGFSFKLHLEL